MNETQPLAYPPVTDRDKQITERAEEHARKTLPDPDDRAQGIADDLNNNPKPRGSRE